MLQNNTTNKLLEMRLTAMADAFRIQQEDANMKNVSFEDRFRKDPNWFPDRDIVDPYIP